MIFMKAVRTDGVAVSFNISKVELLTKASDDSTNVCFSHGNVITIEGSLSSIMLRMNQLTYDTVGHLSGRALS